VASRLVERFYRPTVMLTAVDGLVKGSAHSIEG
jgi:single-stranded-DNA-specific exonuclease